MKNIVNAFMFLVIQFIATILQPILAKYMPKQAKNINEKKSWVLYFDGKNRNMHDQINIITNSRRKKFTS